VIRTENSKSEAEGVTDAWYIPGAAYAGNHEIEGYASATSVNRGETINLYVNTADSSYTISVYRMGWYGGKGGRQVAGPIVRAGFIQPECMNDSTVHLVECDWLDPYLLKVPNTNDPTDWASGIYLAKLVGASGKQSYIIFAVRDDARYSALLFQQSVATYAAYNSWGGFNFYAPEAYKVSLNRPYVNATASNNGKGAGDFFVWEMKALRFLEREGYDVTYTTDIDTHANPAGLLAHKAFLSVGHNEYWTRAMRDAIEGARNAGVNLAFLGANDGFWQIRLEPSVSGAQPNRTLVGYKLTAATLDPLYNSSPSDATSVFRQVPVNRPEDSLIGVMYDYSPVDTDMVISDCTTLAWICSNTGLKAGSVLTGILGHEVDGVHASSPRGITVLASSPYTANGTQRLSSMTYYTHTSGAGVFATGSLQWNWGLDGFGVHSERVNPAVQQITRNILNRFSSR
jgi:hypothetical protein